MSVLYTTNIKNNYNNVIEDSSKAIALKKVATPNYRYIANRFLGNTVNDYYTDMEYDLSEHGRIIDTDSLVASAFQKKKQGILKEQIEFVSKNDRNLKYIKKRLLEFEYVTSMTFTMLVDEIAENMVNFNNCFLLKYRSETYSSGLERQHNNRVYKPIAGLYVIAAPTVDTANNKFGQIIKYRHRITEEYAREFKVDDILHIYSNKRTGITIGTPPLESVKDDVYALRSIEQSAENMIYRNASPFIHVKVGSEKSPARMLSDGVSEVDIYGAIVDNMHEAGGVATPHTVNIELKGAESQALRLGEYLKYFQNRVLAGLKVSEVDLAIGNSTTGGSAVVISQSLKDDIRTYQATISHFVSHYLFNEILLEAPFYRGQTFIPEEDRVHLSFNESDIDMRIKIETHYLNLVQGGLITKEFAAQYIKGMTKKDIQPDPPVETKAGSGTKSNSNVLKKVTNANPARLVKDELITFTDFNMDAKNLFEQLKKEGLQHIFTYDIIDSIYHKTSQIFNEHGRSFALAYLNNYLIDIIAEELYE